MRLLPLYFLDSSIRGDLHFISKVEHHFLCIFAWVYWHSRRNTDWSWSRLVHRQVVRFWMCCSTPLCGQSPGRQGGAALPPSKQHFGNRPTKSSFLSDLCPHPRHAGIAVPAREPDFSLSLAWQWGRHSLTGQTCCLLWTQASIASLCGGEKAKKALCWQPAPSACHTALFARLTPS